MELTHDFTVPASVDDAWATFMDLERVGSCFPGAVVTSVDESGFAGTVKVKLGPIALQYAGTGEFLERDDAAHRAVIEAKGKDKRGNGTAGATVTVQLAPSGEGTRIDVTTDLSVTGKPAQFGRGVMQDVSDKLLQQFVACIESQFAPAEPAAEATSDATATPDAGAAARATAAGSASAGAPAVAPAAENAGRRGPAGTAAAAPGAPGRRLDRPRGDGAAGAGQELRAVRHRGPRRAAAGLADRPPQLLTTYDSLRILPPPVDVPGPLERRESAMSRKLRSAVGGAVEGVDLVADPSGVRVVAGPGPRGASPVLAPLAPVAALHQVGHGGHEAADGGEGEDRLEGAVRVHGMILLLNHYLPRVAEMT